MWCMLRNLHYRYSKNHKKSQKDDSNMYVVGSNKGGEIGLGSKTSGVQTPIKMDLPQLRNNVKKGMTPFYFYS